MRWTVPSSKVGWAEVETKARWGGEGLVGTAADTGGLAFGGVGAEP
jgi:hypothetical protein